MPSERVQRQIDRLLDDAEGALSEGAGAAVAERARAVFAIDAANEDAGDYLEMAEPNVGGPNGAAPEPPSARGARIRTLDQRHGARLYLDHASEQRALLKA